MQGVGHGPRGGGSGAGIAANAPSIRASRTATEALITTQVEDINWDVETFDNGGISHSTTVAPDRFTILTAGRYLIACSFEVLFAAGATDVKVVAGSIKVNGTVRREQNVVETLSGGDRVPINLTDILDLAVGDFIEIAVVATFTGTALVPIVSTSASPTIAIQKIS